MADAPPTRRFTEREVSLILETAAQLQARDGDAAATPGRLTLAELERIGAEVGIDAAHIRRAAQEVEARAAAPAHSRLLGGPTELVIELVVAGEAGDAAVEAALAAVRRVTGELGDVSSVGRLFGWRGRLDGAPAEVSLSAADGRTAIRVRVTLEELAVREHTALTIGLGGGGAVVAAGIASSLLGPAAWLVGGAVAGTGFLLARYRVRGTAERHAARTVALADAVADAVLGAGSTTDGTPALPAPAADRRPARREPG